MTGISEIADGDESQFIAIRLPEMNLEELHPDDQLLMWWWEQDEPALSPHFIDPVARAIAEAKRKKK
jgi:hypothetical protein